MWGSVAALISVCDQLVLKALTTLQVHIFISSFTFIQHIMFIYFCCLVLWKLCHCLGSFSIMSFHIFIMCLLIFVYSFIIILEHFMSELYILVCSILYTTEKEKKNRCYKMCFLVKAAAYQKTGATKMCFLVKAAASIQVATCEFTCTCHHKKIYNSKQNIYQNNVLV